jgi:hypothetical protein
VLEWYFKASVQKTYYCKVFLKESRLDNTILMTIVMSILGGLGISLTALIILVIIGLIIIVLIKLFLVLIPAILVAVVVYFLTGGDLFWTGIAFLVVAALSVIAKL